MDSGEEGKTGNNDDLYGVLGLHKECTSAELKNAYKKLAMRWHPDRCSASGNNKYVEEAKKKFQDIQEAYSVLSDSSKRFLYDVGAYDEDDDDNNNGMGEFLDEMITMMNQTNPTQQKQECGGGGRKNETFEELQELFDEMFNADTMMKPACAASSSSSTLLFSSSSSSKTPSPVSSCQSSTSSISSTSNLNNSKRNSTHMSYGDQDDYWRGKPSSDINFSSFCFGVEEKHRQQQGRHLKRRVEREPVGRTTTAS